MLFASPKLFEISIKLSAFMNLKARSLSLFRSRQTTVPNPDICFLANSCWGCELSPGYRTRVTSSRSLRYFAMVITLLQWWSTRISSVSSPFSNTQALKGLKMARVSVKWQ